MILYFLMNYGTYLKENNLAHISHYCLSACILCGSTSWKKIFETFSTFKITHFEDCEALKVQCGLCVLYSCFLYQMPLIPLTLVSSVNLFPSAAPGRHSLPKQIIAGRRRARVKPGGTWALPQLRPESCRKRLRLYPLRPDRSRDPRNKAVPSACDWSDFPVCIAEVTKVPA